MLTRFSSQFQYRNHAGLRRFRYGTSLSSLFCRRRRDAALHPCRQGAGISQPPLSQQIQRLEREVGTPLFRRLTRGVELTEAGESFYEDARQILAMSDAALEKAKGIARGMNGSLSLGITSSDAFHPQIFTLLHRFQLDHPGVTLHQMEDNMANLMTALSEAELDIAFVRLPCESSKAFNLRIIDEEPMVIALPRDNPLATQPTPPRAAARRGADPLPAGGGPGLYELVYNSCLRAGIDMERAAVVANFVLAEHGQCWLRLRAGSAVDDLHPAAERQLSPA